MSACLERKKSTANWPNNFKASTLLAWAERPFPQQFEKLWASEENNRNLKLLVRVIVCNRPYSDATVAVNSNISDDEPLPSTRKVLKRSLTYWILSRGRCQIAGSCRFGCSCAKVQENRYSLQWQRHFRPTISLPVHNYSTHFQNLELQEIWQQYGTAEKSSMLQLHKAYKNITPQRRLHVQVWVQARIYGTRLSTRRCWETNTLLEQDTVLADKYLVRVCVGARLPTTSKTFDQLSKTWIIGTLPLKNNDIRGHIQRGAFPLSKE